MLIEFPELIKMRLDHIRNYYTTTQEKGHIRSSSPFPIFKPESKFIRVFFYTYKYQIFVSTTAINCELWSNGQKKNRVQKSCMLKPERPEHVLFSNSVQLLKVTWGQQISFEKKYIYKEINLPALSLGLSQVLNDSSPLSPQVSIGTCAKGAFHCTRCLEQPLAPPCTAARKWNQRLKKLEIGGKSPYKWFCLTSNGIKTLWAAAQRMPNCEVFWLFRSNYLL